MDDSAEARFAKGMTIAREQLLKLERQLSRAPRRRFIPLAEWVRPQKRFVFTPEGFIDRYIAPVTRPPIDEIHMKAYLAIRSERSNA
jgi:hypothetical protein